MSDDDLSRKRALPGGHPKRRWAPEHRAAGYHLQEWQTPTGDEKIIGLYEGQNGLMEIRHLAVGHTGAPELEIEWEDGMRVTVLDAGVAAEYLKNDAAKRARSKAARDRFEAAQLRNAAARPIL